MTCESLTELGLQFGLDNAKSGEVDLRSVLAELQQIKLTVVSGAAIGGVSMTVSGIATTDTIISAWEVIHGNPGATGTSHIDRTKSMNITAASTVTCNEGAIGAVSYFYILWFDKTA